jgi:predicted ArsR family transcriptional regulator
MAVDERFWTSTKGRIISILMREGSTVNELVEALDLTDNAIRAQLTTLERDGLVRPAGSRPGRRRPNVVYHLTEKAEQLFPKMYGPLLRHVLDELKERLSPKKLEEFVRAVGRRVAPTYLPVVQASRSKKSVERAVAVLRELGGFCEEHTGDGKIVLRCFECPFAEAVAGHPQVCLLVETVLAEALRVAARQRCQLALSPKCRFEIEAGAG